MQKNLSEILDVKQGSKIAAIGCGGKTAVLNILASENREKKVLLTTTTKIYPPVKYDYIFNDESIVEYRPVGGITVGGILVNDKLCSYSFKCLNGIVNGYDVVLIEADGSRGLPLKGWAEYEPVIPEFIDTVIGIVSIKGLGKPAEGGYVHRLPVFLNLTGLKENQTVLFSHMVDMVLAKDGMYKNSRGSKILLINQADDANMYDDAVRLAEAVYKYDKSLKIVLGSTLKEVFSLWRP